MVSKKDHFSVSDYGTIYSGAVFCVGDNNNDGGFSAPPATDITRTDFSTATLNSSDCVPSATSEPGAIIMITGAVGVKTKNCFSPAGSIGKTSVTQTVLVEPAPLPISVSGSRPLAQPEALSLTTQPRAQLAAQSAALTLPSRL